MMPLLMVLGLYVPIVVLSGAASWLLLTRLVLPSWRAREFNIERYSLALGSLFAMASHWEENIVFGLGRWSSALSFLLTDVRYAVVGKLLIVVGALFTMSALLRAETNKKALGRMALLALSLWIAGVLLAFFFSTAGRFNQCAIC